MDSPEFYAQAQSFFLEICDLPGDEQLKRIAAIRDQNPELIKRVQAMLLVDSKNASKPKIYSSETIEQFKSSADTVELEVSTQPSIEGYEIHEQIGHGGMGIVWRAIQKSTRRAVAIKSIHPTELNANLFLMRFNREVELSARLSHPHIAQVFESGTANGVPYYVMELIDGVALDQYVMQNELPPERILQLMVTICEAVSHAHQRGVIHRDLKPSNVLVSEDGNPHIVDFGIARAITEGADVQLTQAGHLLGTPAYMSPEQASGLPGRVDIRSDVYSLGVILFKLILGASPHDLTGTNLAVIKRISEGEIRRPREVQPQISRDLEAVLLKSLEWDTDQRYGSATEFAQDINSYLEMRPVSARHVGTLSRLIRLSRRNPLISALSTIVVVLFFALAIGGPLVAYHQAQLLGQVNQERLEKDKARIESLLNSDIRTLPSLFAEIGEHMEALLPELKPLMAQPDLNENQKLRLSLALLSEDDQQLEYLVERFQDCTPEEFGTISEVLKPRSEELKEQFWNQTLDQSNDTESRFRAACALASYDSSDVRWQQINEAVVSVLLDKNPLLAGQWARMFEPAREWLIQPLSDKFRENGEETQQNNWLLAGEILTIYAADRPNTLASLIADANTRQFPVVYEAMKLHQPEARKLLQIRLDEMVTQDQFKSNTHSESDSESSVVNSSSRPIANLSIALYRLGDHNQLWPKLKHSKDPTLKSWLVTHLQRLGAEPEPLVERLQIETETSIQRSLILALGKYSLSELTSESRTKVVKLLHELFANNPDAGIHSAADWTLRQWGDFPERPAMDRQSEISEILAGNENLDSTRNPTWYVNSQGQTMVLIPGPVSFTMGSQKSEARYMTVEEQFEFEIERTFSIGITEVTHEQFAQFQEETGYLVREADNYYPRANMPQFDVSWFDALNYCNWLSEKEGIPKSQWCYLKNWEGKKQPGGKFLGLDHLGYRLPTEAEWEYSCRAGAVTTYSFGKEAELTDHYATLYGLSVFSNPIGGFLPNDFGLFDMHGNMRERCVNEAFDSYPKSLKFNYPFGHKTLTSTRGGSYRNAPEYMRSGRRSMCLAELATGTIGFRIARTIDVHSKNADLENVEKVSSNEKNPVIPESSVSFLKALKLSGRGDYIQASAIPFHKLRELTIEAWVKNWNGNLINQGRVLGPRIAFGKAAFWRTTDSRQYFQEIASAIPSNSGWHHRALVVKDGKQFVFINGQLVAEGLAGPLPEIDPIHQFTIGHIEDSPTNSKGEISWLRVSNTARYDELFEPPQLFAPDDQTLLLFDFSQREENHILDLSRNERHGVLIPPNRTPQAKIDITQ